MSSADGAIWHDNKNLLRDHVSTVCRGGLSQEDSDRCFQTAKSRTTDYTVTERHVSTLIRVFSDSRPHDCLDQMDRFVFDVVSDVFFGESAGTLFTELQPVRNAVEEMFLWNTQRILIG